MKFVKTNAVKAPRFMGERDKKGENFAKKADPVMAERLAQAIEEAGGIRDAMRATGISDTQLRRYVNALSSPSADRLKRIADFTGKSMVWFTGHGPAISTKPSTLDISDATCDKNGEIVHVPFLEIRAAAGAGAINPEVGQYETVPVPKAFLRERGAHSDRVHFIRASGDSMSPTIDDGSLVLVDRSQKAIVDGRIYVVSMRDEVRIKRLKKSLSGKVTLHSDGDKEIFPDEELDRLEAEQLVVHGRVFWTEKLL